MDCTTIRISSIHAMFDIALQQHAWFIYDSGLELTFTTQNIVPDI